MKNNKFSDLLNAILYCIGCQSSNFFIMWILSYIILENIMFWNKIIRTISEIQKGFWMNRCFNFSILFFIFVFMIKRNENDFINFGRNVENGIQNFHFINYNCILVRREYSTCTCNFGKSNMKCKFLLAFSKESNHLKHFSARSMYR